MRYIPIGAHKVQALVPAYYTKEYPAAELKRQGRHAARKFEKLIPRGLDFPGQRSKAAELHCFLLFLRLA